eukprot:gene4785-9539_t
MTQVQSGAVIVTTEQWFIDVHVSDKVIRVSCGDARQRVKWLGHVAIARWDDETHQGWKRLGVPTGIKTQQGNDLQMGAVIRDVLRNGDHIFVRTSLDASETR